MPNSNGCLCLLTTDKVEEKGRGAHFSGHESRLTRVSSCILEEKGRVAYFSCHESRLRLLASLQAPKGPSLFLKCRGFRSRRKGK